MFIFYLNDKSTYAINYLLSYFNIVFVVILLVWPNNKKRRNLKVSPF